LNGRERERDKLLWQINRDGGEKKKRREKKSKKRKLKVC
jgi:hypothetical protein